MGKTHSGRNGLGALHSSVLQGPWESHMEFPAEHSSSLAGKVGVPSPRG